MNGIKVKTYLKWPYKEGTSVLPGGKPGGPTVDGRVWPAVVCFDGVVWPAVVCFDGVVWPAVVCFDGVVCCVGGGVWPAVVSVDCVVWSVVIGVVDVVCVGTVDVVGSCVDEAVRQATQLQSFDTSLSSA